MSFGLIQFGATPRDAAYAADLRHRAGLSPAGPAASDFQVANVRPAAPVQNPAEAREQARQQAMAERGVDMLTMFRMSAQERLRAEAAILVETARRARPEPIRATGALIDLRV